MLKLALATLTFFALSPLAEAKVLSQATYTCMAADGAKATYKFTITDDQTDSVWGIPQNKEIHAVNGKVRVFEDEIKTYWVNAPSRGSVLDVLTGLTRPVDNDSRYVQSLILLNVQTVKAYACTLDGGDF